MGVGLLVYRENSTVFCLTSLYPHLLVPFSYLSWSFQNFLPTWANTVQEVVIAIPSILRDIELLCAQLNDRYWMTGTGNRGTGTIATMYFFHLKEVSRVYRLSFNIPFNICHCKRYKKRYKTPLKIQKIQSKLSNKVTEQINQAVSTTALIVIVFTFET